MNQRAFLPAMLVMAACCGPQRTADLPDLPVPTVVRLSTGNATEGLNFNCSAFRISSDLVGTAGHCCADGLVYSLGETGISAEVLVDDDTNDVCLLRAEVPGADIPLAMHDPAAGEPVFNHGFPRGKRVLSFGYWSGRDEEGQGIASIVVKGGSSGSPVLNRRGELVGIVSRAYRDGDSIAFVVPVEHIRAAVFRARALGE